MTGRDAGTAEGDFASCLIWASRKDNELPMLITVQNNYWGISTSYEGQHGETNIADYVAGILGILPIEVYEVASFYSMFNLKPVGKCLLEVCRTAPCWWRGADELVEHLEKKLKIKVGETTPDGMFTLKTVECLGSCGTAPMLQCGADFFENLTSEKADNLVEKLRTLNQRSAYTKGFGIEI